MKGKYSSGSGGDREGGEAPMGAKPEKTEKRKKAESHDGACFLSDKMFGDPPIRG